VADVADRTRLVDARIADAYAGSADSGRHARAWGTPPDVSERARLVDARIGARITQRARLVNAAVECQRRGRQRSDQHQGENAGRPTDARLGRRAGAWGGAPTYRCAHGCCTTT
jgi:hypothetical protein